MLKKYTQEEIMELPNAKECVEGLLSYTGSVEREYHTIYSLSIEIIIIELWV